MIRNAIALFTLLAAFAAPALAVELEVAPEHAAVVRLPGDASAVIVGNPAIADALVHDARTLVITGRVPGRTNIIVVDRVGRVIYAHDILVASDTTGQIAFYQGSRRSTLSCGDVCEEAPAVGDDADSFATFYGQQQQRIGGASAAAGGD